MLTRLPCISSSSAPLGGAASRNLTIACRLEKACCISCSFCQTILISVVSDYAASVPTRSLIYMKLLDEPYLAAITFSG